MIEDGASSSSGLSASSSSSTAGGAMSASSGMSASSSGGAGAQQVTQCPVVDATDAGTNTVIRVQSADPIDMATVGVSSLQVFLANTEIAGSVEADAHSLTFSPQDALPAGQVLEVVLSPTVLDDQGRSLADAIGPWSFTTATGATAGIGFEFVDPVMPPLGDHAVWFAMAMDGEHPVLAWGANSGLVAVEHDNSSFSVPLDVAAGIDPDQVALATGAGRAHIGWTVFNSSGTIFYDAADLPFAPPAAAPVAMSQPSYEPRLAADGAGHNVAMLWQVDPLEVSNAGFQVITSSDGGATWGALTMLDPLSRCADLAYVDGRLVLVWTSTDGINDEYLLAAASSDNGLTFGAPVTLATTTAQFWCPLVVDNGAGAAVIAFRDGNGIGERSTNVTSFIAATSSGGPIIQLAAPDEAEACVRVAASSATGRVVVARTRGHAFQSDFATELYLSDDGGNTFGTPTPVDILHSDEGCAELGYTPSGELHLAWLRDSFTLEWSHGRPKKPCE